MRPEFIRDFTGKVAEVVAQEHRGDPASELTVWLQMGLRREASVGQVYGVDNIERRLSLVRGAPEVVQLMRATFSSIWAQEKAHATYLESVLAAVVKPSPFLPWLLAKAERLLGAVEGTVMSARTSPGLEQQLAAAVMLAVGRHVQEVPRFMGSLATLPFRDFCLLTSELEITAVHGYQRMGVLLTELERQGHPLRDTPLKVDLERFIRDEQFHHQTFLDMEQWFAPQVAHPFRLFSPLDTPLLARLTVDECRARLAVIREAVYGGLPAPAPSPRPAPVDDEAAYSQGLQ